MKNITKKSKSKKTTIPKIDLKKWLEKVKKLNWKLIGTKALIVFAILTVEVLILKKYQIPKLENGAELVAKVKGLQITSEDFYQTLKKEVGIISITNTLDEFIINDKYPTNDSITTSVDEYVEYFKLESGDQFLEYIAYYGYGETEADFRNYVERDYKVSLLVEDYIKKGITEKDIEKYYKNEATGDIAVSHILISPEVTDDMTAAEKEVEEETAYDIAIKVINKLKNNESFADLAKEYSDDNSNNNSGGSLGYISKDGNMVQEFEEAAFKLVNNSYSKTPVKTQFGYHIILKTDTKEKETLEAITNKIIEILVAKEMDANSNVKNEAIVAIYNEYDIKFYDSKINDQYKEYINNLLNPVE